MSPGQFTTWIFSCFLLFSSWEFPFPPERRVQPLSFKCLFQKTPGHREQTCGCQGGEVWGSDGVGGWG